MKRSLSISFTLALLIGIVIYKNVYGLDVSSKPKYALFNSVYNEAIAKEGIREITYGQFMRIRNAQEEYVLLDVRSEENYKAGHIDSALSFPVQAINKENAGKRLTKDSKIIVYCASFQCHASTVAAKTLVSLGYEVIDYKGGVKEWQEKGNKLKNSTSN